MECVAYLRRVEADRCAIDERGVDRMLHLIARCSITLKPKFCWMISTAANPRFEGTRRETIILF
jgi:hypothetical protein